MMKKEIRCFFLTLQQNRYNWHAQYSLLLYDAQKSFSNIFEKKNIEEKRGSFYTLFSCFIIKIS